MSTNLHTPVKKAQFFKAHTLTELPAFQEQFAIDITTAGMMGMFKKEFPDSFMPNEKTMLTLCSKGLTIVTCVKLGGMPWNRKVKQLTTREAKTIVFKHLEHQCFALGLDVELAFGEDYQQKITATFRRNSLEPIGAWQGM